MDFGPIKFLEIPREQNKEADRLANEAMDGNISSRPQRQSAAMAGAAKIKSKNSKLF